MKNYKTKWAIFRLFLVVFVGLSFSLFGGQRTYAATAKEADVLSCIRTASFVDIGKIKCTLSDKKTLVFQDRNPQDGDNTQACAHDQGKFGKDCTMNLNYKATDGFATFCEVKDTGAGWSNGLSYEQGVTVRQAADKSSSEPLKIDNAGKTISLKFNIGYPDQTNGSCPRYGGGDGTNVDISGAATDNIKNILRFSGDTVVSLDGITQDERDASKYDSLLNRSYSLNTYKDISSDGSSTVQVFMNGLVSGKCDGDTIIALSNSFGSTFTRYKLSSSSPGQDLSQYPDLLKFLNSSGISGCNVSNINFGLGNGTFGITGQVPPALIAATPICASQGCAGSAPAAPTTPGATGNSNTCEGVDIGTCSVELLNSPNGPDSSACVANSHTSLEWLICPMMTAISKMADQINGFVENMLNFSVEGTLPDCKDGTDKNCGVNRAWSIIKNIVASLLVIIMLVMVLSQAIGRGPFEAYTVKKILPRLVIAVILMQFSWVLTKYLITISNDLGTGIKQIMLAPFGGAGRLDLPSIMHHLSPTYPAVTNWPVGFAMLAILISFKDFILPLVIFIAVAVGSALFVALATLTFRNILIIMAVIFSPVALLLWVLPGQTFQGYWKKYQDNFIKVLLLFPLVMATIYAGRIGAYLVGNTGWPSFINYIIVLIAYFGPYFFLPKTFKWGGSLLAGVNQAINTNKALGTAKKWGYGLAKNEFDDARLDRQSRLSKSEPYLNREKFGTNRWYHKPGLTGWRKGLATPLRGATSKMGPDGELEGRKTPFKWSGNLPNLLPGGRIRTKGQGWRKAVNEGGDWKEHTDKQNAEGVKRLWERGRNRLLAVGGFSRNFKTGKVSAAGMPAGDHLPQDPSAGVFGLLSMLNRGGEKRLQKAVVKEFFKDLAATGTHINDLIPLGGESLQKLHALRSGWENKYGSTYGLSKNYSDKRGSGDYKMKQRIDALRAIPEDKRTDAQNTELDELDNLREMRRGNLGMKPSKSELAEADKHLKNSKGRLAQHIVEDTHGALAGVKFMPFAYHPAVQEEATAHGSQVAQGLGQIFPDAAPNVQSHFTRSGRDYTPDTDVDSPPDGEHSTLTDEKNALYNDYENLAGSASTIEAAEKQKAIDDPGAKRAHDVGRVLKGDQRQPHLLPSVKRFSKLLQAIKGGDSRLISWVTEKSGTRSTAEPVEYQMEHGMLTPKDLLHGDGFDNGRSILEEIEVNEWKKEPYSENMKATYEDRRDMGFDDNDVQPASLRRMLIALTAHQWQQYQPTWTPSKVAAVFDETVDTEHATQPEWVVDASGNPIDLHDPAVQASLGGPVTAGGLAPPPKRAPFSKTAVAEMSSRYTGVVPGADTMTREELRGARRAQLSRVAVPDNPAARRGAAEGIYKGLYSQISGLPDSSDVPIPADILDAVEVAHDYRRSDPAILKDSSKPEGYGNYKPGVLREKMRIVEAAVAHTFPDNPDFAKRFGQELATQIVFKGIAGQAPADSGDNQLSQLEDEIKQALSQAATDDSSAIQRALVLTDKINALQGRPPLAVTLAAVNSGDQEAGSAALAAAGGMPASQTSSAQPAAAVASQAAQVTPTYEAETVVAEAPEPSEIRIEHGDKTFSPSITAAARNISTAQPTMAMPVVIQSASPISFTPPSVSQVAPTIVHQTIVNKPAPVTMPNMTSGSTGEVTSGSLHGNTGNAPTAGGLNLRGPQAEEFGFNIRDAIKQSLKPVAEAARRGEKVDPSLAAKNAENRINDVIDNMNK